MGFIKSVTSTRKSRQRFYYFRNLTSAICAIVVFQYLSGASIGLYLSIAGAIAGFAIGYMTIAPIVAFIICLIEQMAG
jgi:hypothetical protein